MNQEPFSVRIYRNEDSRLEAVVTHDGMNKLLLGPEEGSQFEEIHSIKDQIVHFSKRRLWDLSHPNGASCPDGRCSGHAFYRDGEKVRLCPNRQCAATYREVRAQFPKFHQASSDQPDIDEMFASLFHSPIFV